MKIFAVTANTHLKPFPSVQEAEVSNPEAVFTTLEDLARLASGWPASRLIALWNNIPGQAPVKKFTSRDIAVGRIWRALQQVDGSLTVPEPNALNKDREEARRNRRTTRKKSQPVTQQKSAGKAIRKHKKDYVPREGTRTAAILGLIGRKQGATVAELMKAIKWQQDSVRGFPSNLKRKAGAKIDSTKRADGERAYVLKK